MSKALKRQGRFVVLRESVTTSGRRLRTYSGREMLRAFGKIARRGRKAVHERETMSLWYAERREEPEGHTK